MFSAYRNPLSYPAGARPRFDQSHPVAGGVRFSAVIQGGGALNVLTGQHAGFSVAPAATVIAAGLAGICSGTGGSTPNNSMQFANQYTGADTSATAAVIAQFPNLGTTMYPFRSGVTGGISFSISTVGVFLCSDVVSNNKSSGITLLAGVPYFLACSFNPAATVFVVKRMDTGQTYFSSPGTPFLAPGAPDGNLQIGSKGSSEAGVDRYILSAMFSGQFNSLPVLLQWAADPWAFWFPRRQINYGSTVAAAAAAGGSRLALMGVGG